MKHKRMHNKQENPSPVKYLIVLIPNSCNIFTLLSYLIISEYHRYFDFFLNDMIDIQLEFK